MANSESNSLFIDGNSINETNQQSQHGTNSDGSINSGDITRSSTKESGLRLRPLTRTTSTEFLVSNDDEVSNDEPQSSNDDQQTEEVREFKTYWTRWYILGLHTLIGLGQVMVYSTWGPIEESAMKGMGFTQTDLALLPNWYNTCYYFSVFPFMWLIQHKGLRSAELITASLAAAGAAIRCLTFDTPMSDRLFIHFGHIVNGLASPIPWIGCTYISAFWFPTNERSFATSVGLASTLIGQATSFLIGPIVVNAFAPSDAIPEPSPEEIRLAIRRLMYLQSFYTQFVLVLVIVYFPSRPPTPPSYTASVERIPFLKGVKVMLSHGQVWLTMCVYAISSAVYASWHQVLTMFVAPAMGQVQAGWVGFAICVVGIVSAPALMVVAKPCIDKHPKVVCTVLMVVGDIFFGFMVLSAYFFKQFFTPLVIWVALVVSAVTYTAVDPMWWEMACEASYPVPESVVSGVFTLASCTISWIYFFLFMFPQLGTDWATWSLLVAEIVIIPVFLFYKPSFKRTLEDQRASGLMTTSGSAIEMTEVKISPSATVENEP